MEQRVGQLEGMVAQLGAALQTADARTLAAEQQAAAATAPARRAGNVVDTRVLGGHRRSTAAPRPEEVGSFGSSPTVARWSRG